MADKIYQGRSATVYLPSRDILGEWQNEAERGGASISEYIFEMVERARLPTQHDPRPDLAIKVSELEAENRQLEEYIRLLKANLDSALTELYKYRLAGFAEVNAPGCNQYDTAMIKLLRKGKTLSPQNILESLGVDPRDGQAVKLVSNQLEELRRFGLVKETPNGWRWI